MFLSCLTFELGQQLNRTSRRSCNATGHHEDFFVWVSEARHRHPRCLSKPDHTVPVAFSMGLGWRYSRVSGVEERIQHNCRNGHARKQSQPWAIETARWNLTHFGENE